jgi:subtilisin family serine protease
MASVWNKLDSGLTSIYLDYLHERDRGVPASPRHHPLRPPGGRLNVSLHYTGDLGEIEALGFQTTSRSAVGRASGNIDLGNLERIAEHPGVVRLSYGREPKPFLDVSVPDINVRGQLWTLAGNVFNGTTGAGVIVGIIDTGIDFRHPFFRDLTNTTRILRIWDQGLLNGGPGQAPPPAALLEDPTGPTYGVEYTDTMINQAVQGASDLVKHKDCNGHGTHVASIAAGDGRDDYKYVGVAPQAKLIMVKYLYLDNEPPVNWKQRFRDAVCYILNTANGLGRSVVINFSVGDSTTGHDGITDGEDFLTNKFAGATGKAFVAAAGNDAGLMYGHDGAVVRKNQHARLEFPVGGGTVDIPIELLDVRTNRLEYNHCTDRDETGPLGIHIYYPFGKTINASVQLPDTAVFIPGPALPGTLTNPFSGRRYTMRHVTESVTRIVGGVYQRNLFEFTQVPNAALEHYQGIYTVKITTTDEMTAHLFCSQSRGSFRVDDSSGLPAIVHVEDRFLIGSSGGASNILTVAAYDAEAAAHARSVAPFSSRGPIAQYGGPAPPDKPDIAAPGVNIDAAMSDDAQRTTCKPNTTQKDGTSMATPHVTGAVALLLEKNGLLTTTQIITTLKTHLRLIPPPVAEEVGAGRLDVKDAFDHLP